MTECIIHSPSPNTNLTAIAPTIKDISSGELIRLEDSNELRISQIDFGGVERGNITDPVIVYLRNMREYVLLGVSIKGYVSLYQQGEYSDTVGSTFLSLDGYNYYNELRTNINVDERVAVYIQWQPRWIASPMLHIWGLMIQHSILDEVVGCPDDVITPETPGITLLGYRPTINPLPDEGDEVMYDAYDGTLDDFIQTYGNPSVVNR